MPEPDSKGVSRRNWVKLAGGIAVSVAAFATGCAPEEKKTVNDTKPKPQPASVSNNGGAEVAQYEKELGVKMTAEQKRAFPQAIKEIRDTSNSLRKFTLSDGGSEPGILFTPTPDKR